MYFVGRDRLRKLLSWIACVAILMGSLAPAISQAFQRDAPGDWTEICTTVGARRVQSDDNAGKGNPVAPIDHLFRHCPYCSLNANALGMPPSSASAPALPALSFSEPERFLSTPRTLFAWIAAQPRAPPRVS